MTQRAAARRAYRVGRKELRRKGPQSWAQRAYRVGREGLRRGRAGNALPKSAGRRIDFVFHFTGRSYGNAAKIIAKPGKAGRFFGPLFSALCSRKSRPAALFTKTSQIRKPLLSFRPSAARGEISVTNIVFISSFSPARKARVLPFSFCCFNKLSPKPYVCGKLSALRQKRRFATRI